MKLVSGILVVLGVIFLAGCERSEDIVKEVAPPAATGTRVAGFDGIGLAIVLDISGSMDEKVADGRKIDIAKAAAIKIAGQAEKFAKERGVKVGLTAYVFNTEARKILPVGEPSEERLSAALVGVTPDGGTAIGEAVMAAAREMNQVGFSSMHILLITDGESNAGAHTPEAVAAAFATMPEAQRPKVYVVAFDTSAAKFGALKRSGWMVVSASDGKELANTLDEVVGGNILLEK